MRARYDGSRLLAALAAGALLGACGSGLYDATGIPALDTGGGNVCNPNQNVCGGVCFDNDATHCGASCADCTASAPPANGQAACLGTGAAAACGYTCGSGFIKCAAGCCTAKSVAAAERSTCAILSSDEVACWGANDSGQVGDGTTAPAQTTPRLVALGASVTATAIATGGTHACAVVGGAVKCWGANDAGQVTGTASGSVPSPTAVTGISGAVAVAAGASHTCALLSTGAVRCWGASATAPAQPIASGATAISAGRNHTCAIVGGPPGAVQCWGASGAPLGGLTAASPLPGIGSLAAGADQSCAATGTTTNALQCWGDSLGPDYLLASPQPTPAVPQKRAGQPTVTYAVDLVATGGHHVCVRRLGEPVTVGCLGANDRGQLGGALPGPGERLDLTLPAATATLAAGASHTCASLADGQLRCWGANDAGQLGDGTTTDSTSPVTPVGR